MAKKMTVAEKKRILRDAGVRYLSNSRAPEVQKYYRAYKKREDEEEIGDKLSNVIKTVRRMDKEVVKGRNEMNSSRIKMNRVDDEYYEKFGDQIDAEEKEFIVTYRVVFNYLDANGKIQYGTKDIAKTVKTFYEEVPQRVLDKVRDSVVDEVENANVSGDVENVVEIYLKEDPLLILDDVDFDDLPMHGEKMTYSFLKKVNAYVEEKFTNHNCVLAMIMDQLQGKIGFRMLTFPLLKKQFLSIGCDVVNGVTVNQLMRWVNEYHPRSLSVFCISPRMIVGTKYVPEDQDRNGAHQTLTFIVNNSHCYPITNEKLALFVSNSKRIDLNNIETFKYTACDFRYVRQSLPEDLQVDDCSSTVNELDDGVESSEGDEVSAERDPKLEYLTPEDIEAIEKKYSDLIDGTLDGQVFIVDDVYSAFLDVRRRHNVIANNRRSNGKMTAFLHPVSNQIIVNGELYHDRKLVCERLFEKYNCSEFMFTNQSFTRMATDLFKIKVGTQMRVSFNTDEDIRIYDSFPTTPLIGTLVEDYEFDPDTCMGIDYKSSYPNAVLNMIDDYPVFADVDSWQPMSEYNHTKDGKKVVVCGEYLINAITIGKLGGIHIQKQVIGHNMMKYLVRRKLITLKDVLLFRKASYGIEKDVLAEFMKEIMEAIPREEFGDAAKRLVNCFIGSFGRRFNTYDTGFVTDSWEMVCAMFNENKEGFSMRSDGGLFSCGNTVKQRLRRENCSIFRQIVCQGQIQLLEMVRKYVGPKSTLIGYTTDSIFVQNPRTQKLVSEYYREEKWHPRLYKSFEPNTLPHDVEPMKEWKELDDIQFDGDLIRVGGKVVSDTSYLEKLKNMSFCCVGSAGCQKSTTMAKLHDPEDTIALSLSAKVADNSKKNGMKNANTLDSQFYKLKELPAHIKRVQVDEFGMIDVRWIGVLYELKQKGIIIQLFGDMNQIEQISDRFFEFTHKKIFRQLCDNNLMQKQYFEKCARYDSNLKDVLDYLLVNKQLHPCFKSCATDPKLELNILCTNKLRHEVNARFCDGFEVGHKVMCNENSRGKSVINGCEYIVVEVLENHLIVSDLDGHIVMNSKGQQMRFLKRQFNLPFAHTIYKYQGSTIEEPYNIYEIERMSINVLYTALSRARNVESIHLDFTDKVFSRKREKFEPTVLQYEKARVGAIYEMYNAKHDVYYVGLSTVSVEERFKGHKNDKKDKMHQYDGEWTVKKICSVFYQDEEFLRSIETRWIHHYMITGHEVINDKQRIKDVKYEMQAPAIVVENKRFQITEGEGCFRIQWRDTEGKKKEKKVRFGKRKSKEDAREAIEEARADLIRLNFD